MHRIAVQGGPKSSPNSLLKYPTERRVRARGLHDFLGYHGACRPGALTGLYLERFEVN